MGAEPSPPAWAEVDLDLALHHLPVGTFVISPEGTITTANDEALQMLQYSYDELVGSSILDLVHPDDRDFTAAVLAEGPRFPGVISGPVHVRYVTAKGVVAGTHLWSRHCLAVEGIEGFVVTFSPEAAEESLYRAVLASVTDTDPERALSHVVACFEGAPYNASAALITEDDGYWEVNGWWPFEPTALDLPGPWSDALDGKAVNLNSPDDMPDWLARLASEVGVQAIWSQPVVTADGRVSAAIVVWRTMDGPPSPNQGLFLDQAAMIAALAIDQAAHRRALEQAAFTDPLTGLGNRTRLARVANELSGDNGEVPQRAIPIPLTATQGVPSSDPAGVLYVDLDGFKAVNDRLGHAAGDRLLAEVADRFVTTVRSTDEVIRVGGDEFVVLCHHPMAIDGLEALAERIIEVVSEEYELADGQRVRLGASVGIDADRSRALHDRITRADAAMYTAKAAGRGRWHHA